MKIFLKSTLLIVFLLLVILAPFSAFAQGIDPCGPNDPQGGINCDPNIGGSAAACSGGGLGQLICQIHDILNSIVPVLLALGVVYFVWGVVNYVIADGEEAMKKGKDGMIFGIIGLAVITSLWGIVELIVNTFDIGGSASIPSLAPAGNACNLAGPNGRVLLGDVFAYVTCNIGRFVIPLIFAIAVLVFVWGVVNFVIAGGNEEAKTKGKDQMIWGIVGLTVMIGVWGLVSILGDTFGLNTSVLPQVTPP